MDIDPDVASWVLEYILRQPLEDPILSAVVRALPLPNDKPNLQKSFLLKHLESEVSRGSISESTLDLLEQLEEVEFRLGNYAVSDAMKRAYCAVAVDCTLKLLVPGDEDEGDAKEKFMFFDMVRRLWRERFGRMDEVVKSGGLGSAIMSAWKEEVEAAVWEDSVCESVMKKFEGVEAVEAVRVYLREETEKMGPSFLELVAESVKNDDGLRQIMGVSLIDPAAEEQPSCGVDRATNGSQAGVDRAANGSNGVNQAANGSQAGVDQTADGSNGVDQAANGSQVGVDPAADGCNGGDQATNGSGASVDRAVKGSNRVDQANDGSRADVDRAANGGNASKEKHMVKGIKHRNKRVGVRRGAKIANSDENNTESSHSRCSLPNTAQVNEAGGALETALTELRVMNPLPEAFRYAEASDNLQKPAAANNGDAISREARQNFQKPAGDNTGEATSSKEIHKHQKPAEDTLLTVTVDVAGVVHSSRHAGDMKKVPKPSLMQRNSSAHVYEWDDSIDQSPEDLACRAVIQIPKPSPLKFYKMNNNLKKRRKPRKWSLQEEDALRKGVEKCGQGCWKAILNDFKDEFDDRTEADLKDKWRNMTR